MIWKVIEIHLRRLQHNRVEWLLTFVVPIAFFSIFALIFTRGVGATPRVKVMLVNRCEPEQSAHPRAAKVIDALREEEGLRVVETDPDSGITRPGQDDAESMVRRGAVTIAIVLDTQDDRLRARLLNDASDEVASQVVSALLTRAFLTTSGLSKSMMPESTDPSGEAAGDDASFNQFVQTLAQKPVADTLASSPVPDIEIVNVMGQDKTNPVISVYAAGIAVMFLLFGATSGGGVLLEERENQTLERLLSSRMTMDHLLLGKWFYLTLLGCIQVTVMFVWAQLVFGLDLLGHLDGFLMMTIVTSAAAASFGLFLATLCQTRGQLNGLSVVLVLTMSALGGSMVPRYVMSEGLRDAGLWTFNAWALDGYDKVFWRDLPPSDLGPQLGVLLATAFVLLLIARGLAVRWEVS